LRGQLALPKFPGNSHESPTNFRMVFHH
jgi:hypothetical protein